VKTAAVIAAIAASIVIAATATAHAATGNTAEDNFTRANQAGWGTTTNNDGLPNYAWARSLATGQPYANITSGAAQITYTGTDGHKAQGYVAVPANQGGDILSEISFSAIGHQLAGVTLSTATNGTAWYQCDVNTNSGMINLVRRYAGVMNWAAQTAFTATAGTQYELRCDVQYGNGTATVSANVWPAGTPEPAGWMIQWTDATPLAAGVAGAMGDWPTHPAAGEAISFLNWAYAASGVALPAS
jgi:hypothetical protein